MYPKLSNPNNLPGKFLGRSYEVVKKVYEYLPELINLSKDERVEFIYNHWSKFEEVLQNAAAVKDVQAELEYLKTVPQLKNDFIDILARYESSKTGAENTRQQLNALVNQMNELKPLMTDVKGMEKTLKSLEPNAADLARLAPLVEVKDSLVTLSGSSDVLAENLPAYLSVVEEAKTLPPLIEKLSSMTQEVMNGLQSEKALQGRNQEDLRQMQETVVQLKSLQTQLEAESESVKKWAEQVSADKGDVHSDAVYVRQELKWITDATSTLRTLVDSATGQNNLLQEKVNRADGWLNELDEQVKRTKQTMDGASDRLEKAEAVLKTSQVAAKLSEDNAKKSEELAKTYRDSIESSKQFVDGVQASIADNAAKAQEASNKARTSEEKAEAARIAAERAAKESSEGQLQSDWAQTNTAAITYIRNKPEEFPPEAHTHKASEVTDLGSAIDAHLGVSAGTMQSLTMGGSINMQDHSIKDVAAPVEDKDAANKAYVGQETSKVKASAEASLSSAKEDIKSWHWAWDAIDGKPAFTKFATAETISYNDLTDLPDITWEGIKGKPVFGSFALKNSLNYSELADLPKLGKLAAKDSIAYGEVIGTPVLGALAKKDSIAYLEIVGTPTLGKLAGKDTLSFNDLTERPTLGALASKDSITYRDVKGTPDFALRSDLPTWDTLTNKPSVFPAESHKHSWEQITNTPSVFPAKAHKHEASDLNGVLTTEDASKFIAANGDRGAIGGYEVADDQINKETFIISPESKDTTWCASLIGHFALNFVPLTGNKCCVKVIVLHTTAETAVLRVTGARWANGITPSWENPKKNFILTAFFLGKEVVLGVFDTGDE